MVAATCSCCSGLEALNSDAALQTAQEFLSWLQRRAAVAAASTRVDGARPYGLETGILSLRSKPPKSSYRGYGDVLLLQRPRRAWTARGLMDSKLEFCRFAPNRSTSSFVAAV